MSKMKDRLRKRQEGNASRGGSFPTWYKLPEGVELYEIKEKENLIDVLPFEYSTNLFAKVPRQEDRAEKGELDYVLIVNVHRNVGPNNLQIVCPKQFGKPCPICEEVEEQKNQGKEYDDYKALCYNSRVLYNIREVEGRNSPIRVWEGPYNWIEKELEKRVERDSARKGEILFADYDEGHSVSFYGEKKTWNKKSFFEPTDFTFEDRSKQPGEGILKETIALDSLITTNTYEEIERVFHGFEEETSEEEPKEEPKEEVKETPKEEVKETPKEEPVRNRSVIDIDEINEDKKCSKGHPFGKAHDTTPDCDNCPEDEWKLCAKAKRK